ncbi:MAG: 3-dehydroquinate synthase [Clostridium sp.]
MKLLNVNLENQSYPIFIGKGLINEIGEKIKAFHSGEKLAIVTDKNLFSIYGEEFKGILEKAGFKPSFIVLEPGEKSKSIEVLQEVYNKLLDFKITRSDLIIAFGGGVVGDLCGFAASTFLRGIPFVQVPTSLLAQIDSSIGGKVAVNLERGKNLVGSFYHPKMVIIDTALLKTLEKRFLWDGMAEVIKYGCISSKELFSRLMDFKDENELLQNIDEIVYCCCSIKRDVVEVDEKDTGLRMILNFGHTIGHSIEKYFDYEKYTHGEAVAMGMYILTKNSEKLGHTEIGTAEKIKNILIKYNLQYELSGVDNESLIEATGLDKKNMGEKLNLIFIKNIGNAFINSVDKTQVKNYMKLREW